MGALWHQPLTIVFQTQIESYDMCSLEYIYFFTSTLLLSQNVPHSSFLEVVQEGYGFPAEGFRTVIQLYRGFIGHIPHPTHFTEVAKQSTEAWPPPLYKSECLQSSWESHILSLEVVVKQAGIKKSLGQNLIWRPFIQEKLNM